MLLAFWWIGDLYIKIIIVSSFVFFSGMKHSVRLLVRLNSSNGHESIMRSNYSHRKFCFCLARGLFCHWSRRAALWVENREHLLQLAGSFGQLSVSSQDWYWRRMYYHKLFSIENVSLIQRSMYVVACSVLNDIKSCAFFYCPHFQDQRNDSLYQNPLFPCDSSLGCT